MTPPFFLGELLLSFSFLIPRKLDWRRKSISDFKLGLLSKPPPSLRRKFQILFQGCHLLATSSDKGGGGAKGARPCTGQGRSGATRARTISGEPARGSCQPDGPRLDDGEALVGEDADGGYRDGKDAQLEEKRLAKVNASLPRPTRRTEFPLTTSSSFMTSKVSASSSPSSCCCSGCCSRRRFSTGMRVRESQGSRRPFWTRQNFS